MQMVKRNFEWVSERVKVRWPNVSLHVQFDLYPTRSRNDLHCFTRAGFSVCLESTGRVVAVHSSFITLDSPLNFSRISWFSICTTVENKCRVVASHLCSDTLTELSPYTTTDFTSMPFSGLVRQYIYGLMSAVFVPSSCWSPRPAAGWWCWWAPPQTWPTVKKSRRPAPPMESPAPWESPRHTKVPMRHSASKRDMKVCIIHFEQKLEQAFCQQHQSVLSFPCYFKTSGPSKTTNA